MHSTGSNTNWPGHIRTEVKPLFKGKQTGLTTIELMLVIVLLGIALTLALPSYRAMIEKRRLVQGTEQVFAFFNSAQAVSARTNSAVTVSWTKSSEVDWCLGTVLGDTACDCTEASAAEADFCAVQTTETILNSMEAGNPRIVSPTASNGNLSYDPVRGMLSSADDALSFDFHSESGDYQLRLLVAATGLASVCSVDATHQVPGYSVCP